MDPGLTILWYKHMYLSRRQSRDVRVKTCGLKHRLAEDKERLRRSEERQELQQREHLDASFPRMDESEADRPFGNDFRAGSLALREVLCGVV
jgi:hypothetical protein